jgi:intracellular sulfur oxidation DsrE/DsrF family protein
MLQTFVAVPRRVLIVFATLMLFGCDYACAESNSSLDAVLKAEQAPAGVVFEIVTGSEDSLDWALPRVKSYIKRIRQRFPGLPVAVVSHGREMFSLRKDNSSKSATKVRQISQQLVADGVTLHVCGTYAGYKGYSEEDFPEFVNVAAEGPAQLNDYVAVGYVRIRVRK